MAADPAQAIDAEFPNLRAEVVAAYRAAPDNVVAEIVDGEVFVMPRPTVAHASAAIGDFVENRHNLRRRLSHNGYVSPSKVAARSVGDMVAM